MEGEEAVENDQFDEVFFKDQEKDDNGSEGSHRSSNLDDTGRSSGRLGEATETSQGRYVVEFDGSPIDLELAKLKISQNEHVMNSPSSDVYLYDESGFSPTDSPSDFTQKAVMPVVSPELLHLIDSAIMGEPEGLKKIKNIVSGVEIFGDEGGDGSVAFLIVDSLLATMGSFESFGDEKDDNPPHVMLNSRAAIVSGELIPWLPCDGDSYIVMSPRTRMVRGLLAILQACTRNRAVCSAAGLLSVLLRTAEKIFVHSVDSKDHMRWDGTPLFCCIQYLAAHSLSVIDLQKWFQVITQTLTTIWAPRLMVAFEKAVGGEESRGPACTFEFVGESSGLLGPGDNNWSFFNGYAFATWIYIESFAGSLDTETDAATIGEVDEAPLPITSPKSAAAAASALAGEDTTAMPRLFSFLSGENEGMEAYFHAQFLVVEIGSGKGKKASLYFTHAFKAKCWYFIGVEHTCLLGKDDHELRLYIDGSLYESCPFVFPQISKPLAYFCVGRNPPPTMVGSWHCSSQCSLFGEMGTIYIFKEPIGPEKMACLARRGSDVLPSFGNGAGLPWLATGDYARSMAKESLMLDAEIAGYIHVLYHPKLLSGRICPDASPSSAAGLLQRPAEVLGQVYIATRMRPVETLWAFSYGGPMSLLPLAVSNMKGDNLEPEQENLSLSLATTALAAPIFRVIGMAIRHPGNSEELSRGRGPEILSKILHYLLETLSSTDARSLDGVEDEELVAAVVSLCQAPEQNHTLKVQLFSMLLLDLEIWSRCNYGLQKRLLSSLTNMVISESSVLQDANAIQMLLDGCRRCYWIVRERDSLHKFCVNGENLSVGEMNALIEDIFIVIELLAVAAPPSSVVDDMHCLIGFMIDCPQPNQVSRVLHLLYRLAVQPNTSRSKTFVEAFLSCGGIEALLILLQREVIAGDHGVPDFVVGNDDEEFLLHGFENGVHPGVTESYEDKDGVIEENKLSDEEVSKPDHYTRQSIAEVKSVEGGCNVDASSSCTPSERLRSAFKRYFVKNGDGVSFKTIVDKARSNISILDKSDGIALGIIKLLSSLIVAGHLTLGSQSSADAPSHLLVAGMHDASSSMFDDKVCLLFFALQEAFHAAPTRLLTSRVCMALLGASINADPTDDGFNFYDSGHRFEYIELLLVLLRSLPYASRGLQRRVLQDLLFLACSHSKNRSFLTQMKEWPEWILELLISNYERGSDRGFSSTTMEHIEDLVHNFLINMLEHCMVEKDGWKEVEAIIHCAEWFFMGGGSSTRDQRIRREESLPIFKRRLLGTLLDFSAQELQVQIHVIAAAAAGVAAVCPSPKSVKAEAESVSPISLALVENSIVILMLVEDHLRLQSKKRCASPSANTTVSSLKFVTPVNKLSDSLSISSEETKEDVGSSTSLPSDPGSLQPDVLTPVANDNGQISSIEMEHLTAAAAAEPYESVSCAFVSYGSCASDLVEGWKYRSRLWYGVGLPSKEDVFGGGGSGWESWKSTLEKDSNGKWIELPLVKKSIAMLQALLLDETGLGDSLCIGGGSGTGMGGMDALYQLLDSDQPFLCMFRMVLLSMREEDSGEDDILVNKLNYDDLSRKFPYEQAINIGSLDTTARVSMRPSRSALLWSVLSPILNMPISEAKRLRVLVTSCVLYSEIWHAVGKDRKPLRKKYLEAIIPAFVAILRRWRPVLARIHELATPDGLNPLIVDGEALAADTLPIQAALGMISSGWAAAFASPPAAMALAMIAAGASGGAAPMRRLTAHLRRDGSLLERKRTKLQTFSSFQEPHELPKQSPSTPRDKAAAKAAALAAARDLERNAKIGSGRGLIAVAMATSAQRRSASDMQRVQRWIILEAMGIAWMECLHPVDTKSVYGKDLDALAYEFIAVLVASFALARNIQRSEIDRRNQVAFIAKHRLSAGSHAWRKLIHYLIETSCLFGPSAHHLCNPEHVYWRINFMESSSRMRRCLRRNYRGFDHFGAPANFIDHVSKGQNQLDTTNPSNSLLLSQEAISANVITNGDGLSKSYNASSEDFEEEQHGDGEPRMSNELPKQLLLESTDNQVISSQDMEEVSTVVAPGYIPSELDERIILEVRTSMVRLLKVAQGIFQITSKRINFIADNAEGNAASDRLDCTSRIRDQVKNHCWMTSSLCQVYSRRYLLRRSALELCMLDRSSFFFDFGSNEGRRNAYRAIIQARPFHLKNLYLATERPDQLLSKTKVMERWARREITNFEYLMELNTLAGRSYNDITQYPVFPWILSDYSSKDLDLSNPASYRDLSKPVGALNPEHLLKIQERYSSFRDPCIPKFHHGSHYSSVGTVLFYLVRLEPFTTLSIQLTGGKSNHGERMFSDVAATWRGVLEDTSDVKELVPELFYLPETLISQQFDVGKTKYGEELDDVKLPPWAKNPVDFVHKHRMALESEHVSAHLHEWIDLIFGYKQRGKEAIATNNVFFCGSYEGAVDINKISDLEKRCATQYQMAYLGQTPSQLLTVPHMKRMPLANVLHLQTIFRNPKELKPYVVPMPEHCNLPASAIHASSDVVIVVDTNAPAAHIAQHKWQPNTPDGQGAPFLFQYGKPATNSTSGGIMRLFKGLDNDECQFPRAIAFATPGIRSSAIVGITKYKEIISGGHADNSIRLVSPDGAKTLEVAFGHCAPVTCLSLSSDSNYLVTGSQDTTVILWRIHSGATSQSSSNVLQCSSVPDAPALTNSNALAAILAAKDMKQRIEGPMCILHGHHREIVCCCVNSDLGVVVSCSRSSDILLHRIARGRLIRRLVGVVAHEICVSSDGIIMAWNQSLQTLTNFTLNGILITRAKLPFYGCISCIEVSSDGQTAVIGVNSCPDNHLSFDKKSNKYQTDDISKSNDNQDSERLNVSSPSICFLDFHTLKVLHMLDLQQGQDTTALALNEDNTHLLVSTKDNQFIIFTHPAKT